MENNAKWTAIERGTRLSAELGSRVVIEFEGIAGRLKSILVGMDSGTGLILRIPAIAGVRGRLQVGRAVIVRYMCSGMVYGFRSRLLGHVVKPFPLMFLAYPDEIESLNLRETARVQSNVPALAQIGPAQLKGLVLDISRGGCRFTTKETAVPDEEEMALDGLIELTFPLLGVEGEQTFRGRVRNLHRDPDGLSVGVQFEDIAPELNGRIEAYVQNVTEVREEREG